MGPPLGNIFPLLLLKVQVTFYAKTCYLNSNFIRYSYFTTHLCLRGAFYTASTHVSTCFFLLCASFSCLFECPFLCLSFVVIWFYFTLNVDYKSFTYITWPLKCPEEFVFWNTRLWSIKFQTARQRYKNFVTIIKKK